MSNDLQNGLTNLTDDRGNKPQSAYPMLRFFPCAAVILVALLGGMIRFHHLSHPALWYDESMVFRRTCGSYSQLLDCLRTDGFVPLHYSLVWVISRWFRLTPFVLRFVPALSGTLTVPAIYFFARQLVPQRTALLVAMLTACSAFMLFYSRDAKMYMPSWLLVTLGSGSLLWWFRSKSLTAWLCWVASNCAACGYHASSGIPVAISCLLLLTQHRMHWHQMFYWLAGAGLIFAGPIGYYEKFNRWDDISDDPVSHHNQLEWVEYYNYGRTGPELARLLGTSMLMGWEWPRQVDLPNIPAERFIWPSRAAELLAIVLLAGCLPWPDRWRSSRATPPHPQWRLSLWLLLWTAVPVYGFYCRSVQGFASPVDWWHSLADQFPGLHQAWFTILCSAVAALIAGMAVRYPQVRPKILRGLLLLLVAGSLLGLFQITAITMKGMAKAAFEAGKPWESLWVPRYLGFIWPTLAIMVAALLMRLPTRWVRWPAIVFVLGLNLGIASFRILGQTEPPVGLMAADAFYAGQPAHHMLFWTNFRSSGSAPGGGNIYGEPGQYYLELLENKPVSPALFWTHLKQRRSIAPPTHSLPWDHESINEIDQIIFWREYEPDTETQASAQDAEPSPPDNWKLQSDQWFTAREYWTWQDEARYRRTVYSRAK